MRLLVRWVKFRQFVSVENFMVIPGYQKISIVARLAVCVFFFDAGNFSEDIAFFIIFLRSFMKTYFFSAKECFLINLPDFLIQLLHSQVSNYVKLLQHMALDLGAI